MTAFRTPSSHQDAINTAKQQLAALSKSENFLVAMWDVTDDGKVRITTLKSHVAWEFPTGAIDEACNLLKAHIVGDIDEEPIPLPEADLSTLHAKE